eukprot:TRINITY_DN2323_c0_g1_i1.p1 TRINITY_DN2323_c0_g1~~TRINITY_DN2323_c0_g1_i1.p1  ORF type:complete len:748 (-),score=162.31 TRINITY_DN2323_c0_g1_i1:58-2301(-)
MAESFVDAIQKDVLAILVCALGFLLTMFFDSRKRKKLLAAKTSACAGPVKAAKGSRTALAASTFTAGQASAQVPAQSPLPAPDAEALAAIAGMAGDDRDQEILDIFCSRLAGCDLSSEIPVVRQVVLAALRQDRLDDVSCLAERGWSVQGVLLRELVAARRAADLERIFQAIPSKKAFHYNTVLDACASRGDLDFAERYLRRATAAKSADVVTYNTMVKALTQRGELQKALALVEQMQEAGFSPNCVTFNQILDASSKQGLRRVWAVLDTMSVGGVKHNFVTASIVLKLLQPGTPAADVDRAFGLLKTVEGPMDEVALGSILEAAIRVQRTDILRQSLRAQQGPNPVPVMSCHTFGSMIRAYGVIGDVKGVWRVWQDLLDKRIPWTCVTLGNMTEALSTNGATDDALDLVRDACKDPSRRTALTSVTFGSLLKGFSQQKRYDEVWTVYGEMKNAGLKPSLVTLNTLVNACVQCRKMERISSILDEMADQGIAPDIITYSSVIKGYCQDGRLDQAFQVLDEVNRSPNLRPDEFTYNSLIDGCARASLYDRGMQVYEQMQNSGIRPSNFTLSVLVKLAGRARRLDSAFRLCEEVGKDYGFKLNIHVFDNLLQACLINNDFPRAVGVLRQMVTAGVRPDKRTYKLLLGGTLQNRDVPGTVWLLRALAGLPLRQPVPATLDVLQDLSPTSLRPHGQVDIHDLVQSTLEDLTHLARGSGDERCMAELTSELQQVQGSGGRGSHVRRSGPARS